MLAGALGVGWTMLQPFATGALLFGRAMLEVWEDLVRTGSRLLGLDPGLALVIVLAVAGLHLLLGAAAGLVAWQLGAQLEKRLHGEVVVEQG
jgi:hypothetical protein